MKVSSAGSFKLVLVSTELGSRHLASIVQLCLTCLITDIRTWLSRTTPWVVQGVNSRRGMGIGGLKELGHDNLALSS